jgi:cysteine desulfurase
MIYCDNAATTNLDPRLAELLAQDYANPSSLHSAGRKAKAALEEARTQIAASIKAEPEEIIFTSGATESNNTVLAALDYDLLITSPSEHASLLEPAKAHAREIIWLNLNQEGFINCEELEAILAKNANKKILVSIMHGNNEIATVQDIARIGALCKKHNALFHTDAAQTWLKLPIDVRAMNIDALSASAHKVHGPRGTGFLYLSPVILSEAKDPPTMRNTGLILGGGQEHRLRAGTENVASIVAMAELTKIYNPKKLRELENTFIEALSKIPGLVINGPQDRTHALPGIINLALTQAPWLSEQLVLQMDLKGICISSGSACSSNKAAAEIQSSYVLRACQLPDEIASKSVRISLSILTTETELSSLARTINSLAAPLTATTR